jgi:hypothetical protein
LVWVVIACVVMAVLALPLLAFVVFGGDPSAPKTIGVTGVGVDAHGGLIGYVAVCRDHIGGASLYEFAGPKLDELVPLGAWASPRPVRDVAKWALSEHSEWSSTARFQPPAGTAEFDLSGSAHDHASDTSALIFDLSDLTGVKPGHVLYKLDSAKTVGEASFRAQACAEAGMPVP